jgi:hypothetical protein
MAIACKGKKAFMRHSGDLLVKANEVQDALRIVRADFLGTLDLYKALANDTPSHDEVDDVLTKLFPDTKSDRANLQRNRVKALWHGGGIGSQVRGVEGTSWGLYNATTEIIDHHANEGSKRADADDMRLNSIWFGSGATFKQTALDTIAEVCLR